MGNRKGIGVVAAAAIVVAMNTICLAAPVPVTLQLADFSSLLGGSANPVGSPSLTDMSAGNLRSEVVSQAFTDEAGSYAYLYQVKNTGTTGNNVVEVFTCSPFFNASDATTVGYLTANAPSGFTLGNQTPYAASIDAAAGPTVSFAFPAFISGCAIDPTEYSSTLYVLSDGVPGIITGNVIDGEIGSGDVVGPVPEPTVVSLVVMGGLVLLRRRRRGM